MRRPSSKAVREDQERKRFEIWKDLYEGHPDSESKGGNKSQESSILRRLSQVNVTENENENDFRLDGGDFLELNDVNETHSSGPHSPQSHLASLSIAFRILWVSCTLSEELALEEQQKADVKETQNSSLHSPSPPVPSSPRKMSLQSIPQSLPSQRKMSQRAMLRSAKNEQFFEERRDKIEIPLFLSISILGAYRDRIQHILCPLASSPSLPSSPATLSTSSLLFPLHGSLSFSLTSPELAVFHFQLVQKKKEKLITICERMVPFTSVSEGLRALSLTSRFSSLSSHMLLSIHLVKA
jgi:hypothetical protein